MMSGTDLVLIMYYVYKYVSLNMSILTYVEDNSIVMNIV